MFSKYVVAVACMLLGVAQAQSGDGAQAGTAGNGGAPNDAQIAAIVVAANQADIDAGKAAEARSHDKSVKDFAQTMVRDHESVNAQAKALVKKLGVKPEPSATSKSLAQGGKENVAALTKLRGAEFDKAYVDHEVAYHQQVLDAIKSTLIPDAKNPQLKALIEKATPVFEAHLDHAKQLQAQLASGTGTASSGHHAGSMGTGSGSSGK